jgi:hypothetical protein
MRSFIYVLLATLGFSVSAQEALPPYIYYYSDALNAFVIERVDGSDSRMIGQGLTEERADVIGGPGWSPDGQWLAWSAGAIGDYNGTALGGYAVRADGNERLELPDAFSAVYDMRWGPDGQWLFVSGSLKICDDYPCPYITYWLMDVETQRLIASLDFRPAPRGAGSTPFEWLRDGVGFYDQEYFGNHRNQHYRITMGFDGSVTKQPISQEDYEAVFTYYEDTSDYPPLDSPSGHYVAPAFSETLTDRERAAIIVLPFHSRVFPPFGPMAARWHPSEQWVLLGYNMRATESLAVGYVSVMGLDGSVVRELSSCGFDPGCVNCLPEYVNVDDLPAGASESVLPAPISYDYNVEFEGGPDGQESYALACDMTNNTMSLVQDGAGQPAFVLHSDTPCPTADTSWTFPFALSPSGDIYAANEGYGLNEHTGLYDATTGERLVVLNTLGWELSFSDDGSRLMMRSQNARITWDVEELLGRENNNGQ